MKVYLLFIVCFLFSVTSWSQKGKAALSQRVVDVGETFTLTYAYPLPKVNALVEFNSSTTFLSATSSDDKTITDVIEIFQPFRDTIMNLEDGPYWIGVYELICWDSGTYILPPTSVVIDGKRLSLPSVSLSCQLLPHQQAVELYDIKENFVELPHETGRFSTFLRSYWWIILLIVIIILCISFLKRKRKKSQLPSPIQSLSLEEKTLLAIDTLMQKELWKNGRLKEHYVELSMLLKSFLGEVYVLELKERTTAEIILLLKQKSVDSLRIDELKVVFQQADLVKFAKSEVVEEGVFQTTQLCKDIVKKITQQLPSDD